MIQRITVSNEIQIVFSFQEYGYADVLLTFNDAEWIDIVTYNLSDKNSALFNSIRDANKLAVTRLITNIPQHWNTYWGPEPKARFRQQLERYRSILDPRLVGELASFFNVSNHAKIVMTNKLAYIGSSNFSPESQSNFECGVLFSSPDVIEEIRSQIVDYLVENSAPRDLSEIGKTKLAIQDVRNQLKNLMITLVDGFLEDPDTHVTARRVFRRNDAEVSVEDLHKFSAFLGRWELLREELQEHPKLHIIADCFDLDLYGRAQAILEDKNGALFKLAQFGYEDAVNRHWQKYAAIAYDELVDRYMIIANDDAQAEHVELIDSARDSLKRLLKVVAEMLQKSKESLDMLQVLEMTKWGVDNT